MYIRIGKYIYFDDPNMIGNELIRCGEICMGIDGPLFLGLLKTKYHILDIIFTRRLYVMRLSTMIDE